MKRYILRFSSSKNTVEIRVLAESDREARILGFQRLMALIQGDRSFGSYASYHLLEGGLSELKGVSGKN